VVPTKSSHSAIQSDPNECCWWRSPHSSVTFPVRFPLETGEVQGGQDAGIVSPTEPADAKQAKSRYLDRPRACRVVRLLTMPQRVSNNQMPCLPCRFMVSS